MEPSDTVLCQWYGTTGGIKLIGMHNIPKMVMVHGSPCVPTPLTLILNLEDPNPNYSTV